MDRTHDCPPNKTAVETIFVGKARQYNRRFLQMCSHHLIEPVACTPAAGWEKGQVENQVGNLRDQVFRPKPRVTSLEELNAWLEDQCIAYARRTRHPEFKDQTIWEVFQEERPALMELRSPFDGFVEKAVRASTTCLVMADHNRYSVDARAENESAVQVMGNDSLKVIAHELLESLKGNVTVDWSHRESARARMRMLVKRILRKHGNPPDLQDAAVQTVLRQAEALTMNWASSF